MDSKKEENKDHLSPTNINEPQKDNSPNPDLSHEELQERIDNYGKIGGKKEVHFDLQKLKKAYLKEVKEKQANRDKASIHYAMGASARLPQVPYEYIKEMENQQDQKIRNDVAKEAKEKYRTTNSLEKSFKEKSPLLREGIKNDFNKNKEMDIDI